MAPLGGFLWPAPVWAVEGERRRPAAGGVAVGPFIESPAPVPPRPRARAVKRYAGCAGARRSARTGEGLKPFHVQ
jgi:hypothetical protein